MGKKDNTRLSSRPSDANASREPGPTVKAAGWVPDRRFASPGMTILIKGGITQ
jgi:hypothetical protein